MGPNQQMQQQQLALTNLKRRKRKKIERDREKKTGKKVNKQQETEQMIDLLTNASDSSIILSLFINIRHEN